VEDHPEKMQAGGRGSGAKADQTEGSFEMKHLPVEFELHNN